MEQQDALKLFSYTTLDNISHISRKRLMSTAKRLHTWLP